MVGNLASHFSEIDRIMDIAVRLDMVAYLLSHFSFYRKHSEILHCCDS